jgi:hypothetical protein
MKFISLILNSAALLALFSVVSCKESFEESISRYEYEGNKAFINYAKQVSQIAHLHKKHFFRFVYPPDTTYNFISRRHYISDSSFIDYQILGSSPTDLRNSLYFEIKNGHWYLFDGYKWQLFYDGKKIYPVNLFYASKRLTKLKTYQFQNDYLYSFEPYDIDMGPSAYYLCGFPDENIFSPKQGMVLIKTSSGYFRRTDFNFNPKELKLVETKNNNDEATK